jgi:RNA polymerase sigma-70 factor (ECF subfamily)
MSEEKKLVKQCKRKNARAFDRLYNRYSPVLFAICMRYASNKTEAEDMLQESFLTIFNKIDSYRYQGSFEGWLKRITVNTAINIIRKNARSLQMTMTKDEYHEVVAQESDVISQMSEKDILNCIQHLPSGYRTVFNLYVIEGYKHKEIAEMLNISENTSRTQLIKARKALKLEMENLEIRR